MKSIGKILLSLLLLVLLAIVVIYLLLQTRPGARWISDTISANSAWHLTFSKMEHNFSDPAHLILNDVSFGERDRPATLTAKKVDLGLSVVQFTEPFHFASIWLEQGSLTLAEHSRPVPLSANRLQLNKMAVNRAYGEFPITAQGVDGGVMPWKPAANDFIGNDARFQLSAASLNVKGIPVTNLLLQGRTNNKQLAIDNFGADVALGSITASAQRDAQNNWQVASLRLNSIRLQSQLSLNDFLAPLMTLPSVHFDRVDITDARLEGNDWAITDLDLALKNIRLQDGDWQSDDGALSMNASTFVNGSLQLNDPIVNMTFSPTGIALTQASSRWANGLIRTSGNWTRSDKKLTLDELAIAGMEYTLPGNWRQRWQANLPAWLNSVELTKFSASHNLIIDIDPAFPLQMTSLDGNGSHLLLARDRQWGIWSGQLSFNAAEATFNRVDLRHPSVALNADGNTINLTELSAFAGEGMVEGTATISQQPQRALSLTLNGRQVPVNLLHDWGWPALSLEGNGDLQLKAQASLAQETPLRPTVNGTLSVSAGDKSLQQTMQAGQVAGSQ